MPLALLILLTIAAPTPQPRLGINLSGPADWSSQQLFVDVARLSRPWISQKRGQPWGKGPPLELDERGNVRRLTPDSFAETVMLTLDGHYPVGDYTLLYKGRGKLEAAGAGRVVNSEPGRMTIAIDPQRGGSTFLRLLETDPDDPVHEIRLLMPGVTDEQARENPWNPAFLKLWRGTACLRFMDLMQTNNSEIRTWADRPQLTDANFCRHGVPAELLCDLANRLDCDAWFCVPHQADDDYIRNLAALVKDKLAPGHKAYIEYSNEVWNSQFAQHRYAGEQGRKLGFAEKTWEAAWLYTAVRSVEIFTIWESVFSGTNRLVRVLPSQVSNSYVAGQILGFHDAGKHADVLAIAPYLSLNVGPNSKPPADGGRHLERRSGIGSR